MSIENRWNERGDAAAREDIRAGNIGAWDEGAVLNHIGLGSFDQAAWDASIDAAACRAASCLAASLQGD